MIPEFIKNIKGLKIFDRCLLTQIHYLSALNGYCFAGNQYFAQFFEVSEGTVKRSLKKMEDMNLIARKVVWNKRYMHLTCLPEEQKNQEENMKKEETKETVKYSRAGFRFLQKLNERPTEYHRAPKDQGWTEEGVAAANGCFERWKKKIGGSG